MRLIRLFAPIALLALALSVCLQAAPLRHLGSVTGPPRAQWFRTFQTNTPFMLNNEFYDNTTTNFPGPQWGSAPDGWKAITGYVKDIHYDIFGNLSAFSLHVTITNDSYDYGSELWGTEGANDLDQSAPSIKDQTVQTMSDTRLTADFSDDGILWNSWGSQSNIRALNYDDLAWYGWSASEPPVVDSPFLGNYCIPAWRFGDIAPGQSSTRELQFSLYSHEMPGSALFNLLHMSKNQQLDLLSNRSNSLKISGYSNVLVADDGTAFPTSGSNVSVFFGSEDGVVVATGPNSPSEQTWFAALEDRPMEMLHLRVTSRAQNIVAPTAITLQSSGSGDDAVDVQWAQVWVDTNRNGRIDGQDWLAGSGRFTADNGQVRLEDFVSSDTLFPLIFPPNDPVDLILALVLKPNTSLGKTFQLSIVDMEAVEITGVFQTRPIRVSGMPVEGCVLTTVADPDHLKVRKGINSPERTAWWPARGSISNPVIQIGLEANSGEPMRIDSIEVRPSGEGDPYADIAFVEAWIDNNSDGKINTGDEILGTGTLDEVLGTCTIGALQEHVIPAGTSENIILALVMAQDVDTSSPKSYSIQVEHIAATYPDTDQDAMVIGLPLSSSKLMVFDDQPAFAIVPSSYSQPNYEWWPSLGQIPTLVAEVSMFTESTEELAIKGITLQASGTGDDLNDIISVEVRHDAYGLGRYFPSHPVIGTGSFDADDGYCHINLSGMFISSRSWEDNNTIFITYTLAPGVAVGSTFRCDIAGGEAVGMDSGWPAIAAISPQAGGTLTVLGNPPSLSVNIGNNQPKDKAWNIESDETQVIMIQFDATCDADRDIKINSVQLFSTGSANDTSGRSIRLWDDINNNGAVDEGDVLLFQGWFNTTLECTAYPIGVNTVVLPAGSTTHFLVTYEMAGQQIQTGHTHRLIIDSIDSRWADDSDVTAPVFGLPLSSCTMVTTWSLEKVSIPEAKQLEYGSWVELENKVVTAVLPYNTFVVQEPDRTAGITMRSIYTGSTSLKVGDRITVIGQSNCMPVNSYIEGYLVSSLGAGELPRPLGMNVRAAGGSINEPFAMIDFWNETSPKFAFGINKEDMLIKVIGRVTWVEPGGGAFYINDGSGIWDGTRDETHGPVYGMQVLCPDEITPPARGAFVAVTGIFQPDYTDLELPGQEMMLMKRSIRPRSNEDIQVILAAQ